MSRLNDILRQKNERRTRLQASLDSITSQLKSLGALKVVLFGSFVKGDVDVNSDLDLFVLMPSTRTGKEWMDMVYEMIERKVASDIIIYNVEEFNEKLPTSSFLQKIMKGKVVYEKNAERGSFKVVHPGKG